MASRLLAVVLAAALGLGACQTLMQRSPPTDPAFLAALNKAKADGAPLFAALKQSSGCTATANAAAFGTVETDLTGLRAQASVPNNDFTQRGVADLQSGFGVQHFTGVSQIEADRQTCLGFAKDLAGQFKLRGAQPRWRSV